MRRASMFLLGGLLLLLAVSAVQAVDVAVPSDFPHMIVENPGVDDGGYYFCGSSVYSPNQPELRPYAYMLDFDGNVVWYRAEENPHNDTYNMYVINDHYIILKERYRGEFNTVGEVYDNQWNMLYTFSDPNPIRPTMELDHHEAEITPDGHLWTLWADHVIVDMSDVGGYEECEVESFCIQEWDENGDVVWDWRGIDHLDQLPYKMMSDTTDLVEESFTHLYINSFDVQHTEGNDVIVNARRSNQIFRIDYDTGDVEWAMGGFDYDWEWDSFEFVNGFPTLPDDVTVGFYSGHDARLLENGTTLTFYDNNTAAQDPYNKWSAGRTYELDYNDMTATLTWWWGHPIDFTARITGSHKILPNGNHLIGWGGGIGPQIPKSATEVTHDGDMVWEIKVFNSMDDEGRNPRLYRWYKLYDVPADATPYISYVMNPTRNEIELYANWFGHEDEVEDYEVYVGLTEDSMVPVDVNDDGEYIITEASLIQPYYCQMQPLDGNGDPIGPMSNMVRVQYHGESGLDIVGLTDEISDEGGDVFYAATITNASTDLMWNLRFKTYVVAPNGQTYGPLLNVPFNLFPLQQIDVSSLSVEIPGWAGAGVYQFYAEVTHQQDVIWTDGFEFEKLADPDLATIASLSASDFISRGDLSPFAETIAAAETEELPGRFRLNAAWPNPFNPTTTVSVYMPHAADLTVNVYNVQGQLVTTLADGSFGAGEHRMVFDGSNLASGMYLVQAVVPGEASRIQKVMLVR